MFKPKFRIALAGLLTLGLITLAGCGSTGAPSQSSSSGSTPAATDKVLKVGSDITFAPFEFMDQNQKATGFDMDLIQALGKDMGYSKVNVEAASFDGLITALQAGKYDAVISAMTITDDRAKSVDFSNKYFESVQYIAMKKGAGFKTLEDLKGKRVGVQLNTTGQYDVEAKGIDPKKYDTLPDAMNDLLNGGLDAVVCDGPVMIWFQTQNPSAQVDVIQANVDPEFYGIAMKKGDTDLVNKMNASLKKLMDNGTYNDIYKKWFKKDAPKLD